jgi:hypothetical protein
LPRRPRCGAPLRVAPRNDIPALVHPSWPFVLRGLGSILGESAWATELPILPVSRPGIGANVRHFKSKNGLRVRFFLFLGGAGLRTFGRGPKTTFFRHKREQPSKGRGTPRSARRTSGSMIRPARGRETRNSNIEIRNKFEIQMFQVAKRRRRAWARFEIGISVIGACFGFRDSCFEFAPWDRAWLIPCHWLRKEKRWGGAREL